jgi:hypothetical protein
MTGTITFRPKRSKKALQDTFGNVSATINQMIEQAMVGKASVQDWRDALKNERPTITDDQWEQCLRPE